MKKTNRPSRICRTCDVSAEEETKESCEHCGEAFELLEDIEPGTVVAFVDGELFVSEEEQYSPEWRVEDAAGKVFDYLSIDLGWKALDEVEFYDSTSKRWFRVQVESRPEFTATERRIPLRIRSYNKEFPFTLSQADSHTVGRLADRAAEVAGLSKGPAYYLQRVSDEIMIDRDTTMRESGLVDYEEVELVAITGVV